jgi:DNA (cytosine-5)-methyltransferase 1
MAGGEVLLAVEWDDNAVATYKANYPATRVYHGDIGKLSVDEVLHQTGLSVGDLDVLDGSPPCQGFSTAGKRMMDDPRNQLFREYIRLLRGLKPKVFVMENVSGMVKGKMKIIFAEILKELKESGYRVKARLMNAMYYGVPQSRQRMIFVGVREDLGMNPSHPNPQTRPIPLKEVLPGINNNQEIIYPEGKAKEIGKKLKPWQDGSDIVKGSFFNLKKLDMNQPSRAITKTIRRSQCGHLHPEENRFLTIPELKRIASYPDDYIFLGKFEEQWARIGNSVPPLFMKAIATHINENILSKINGVNT